MWTLLRLTLDRSVDTAKNAQVPLRKSCRPPRKCHKKYSAQQPSTVFAFRWWFAWHANESKSSSCVVVVVLSDLDVDGHQQTMVIHFDCGGLGHDLLCAIPKSNCDLNEFNFSNLFCITHLPNLKGFLSESKMVYVLLHLVNHGWGYRQAILTMTQLMTHSDTTQSLGFLSIDRLDWVTVATRKPDVDTLEANHGPECRYGEKRASPSTKIMQASKEMPQKIFCTTAKYSLCI